MAATPDRQGRTRVVILGGGFAGAACAQALERHAQRLDLDITVINRNNYFVFTPLLVEAGTGSLEPRHAVVPLRDFLRRSTLRTGEVLGLDHQARQVHYRVVGAETDEVMAYDHLVVALGSVTRMPPLPGLVEHGFQMKSLGDAVALRDRAIQLLEQADACTEAAQRRELLHFVVVGANFSGVEVAGEFFSFLREAARRYTTVVPDECTVTLVEIAPRILTALDEELSAYGLHQLRKCGMRVELETGVAEVTRGSVLLSTGERLSTRTVIWCAGVAPSPLASQFGLPSDDRGALRCEPDLRVHGFDTIWAIGDCAANPSPHGGTYPATAQHAVRQGTHLARNIERSVLGKPPLPCRIHSPGTLAALGCRTAVAKVMGLHLSGFPAWFLWRTVYLLKMPGWNRRLRVALDWTMGLLFSRTIVQLGVHRSTARQP